MPDASHDTEPACRVLLCFDGSDGAAEAIAKAGAILRTGTAILLTVWEPCAVWEPYDPATILSAPLARFADRALGLDESAQDLARAKMERGVMLASDAGFEAVGRVAGARRGVRSATSPRRSTPRQSSWAPGASREWDRFSSEVSRPRSPLMPGVRC